MHATQQQTSGPNIFKPSLLAWRASYLAGRAVGGRAETDADPRPRPPRIVRPRRFAARW
jgi:hypothetical protein